MTLIQNIKCTLRPDLRGAWLAQLRNHREDAYTEKLHFYDSREQALNDKTRVVSGQDNLDHSKLRMVNLGAYLKGHGADDVMFVHATLGVVTVAGGGHYFHLYRALYLTCISPVSCPVSHLYLTCIPLVSHLYLTCIVP